MGSNFSGALFKSASIARAKWTDINLEKANLKYTRVAKAVFKNVNFSNADLRGVSMIDFKGESIKWTKAIYDRKSILPFPIEDAGKYEMILKVGEVLAEQGRYLFVLLPVEGQMSDFNINKTCVDGGLKPPSINALNGDYSDDKCLDVNWREGSFPMRTISTQICAADPNACPKLNGVFIYLGGKFDGGSCGVVNSTWCARGNDFTNQLTICTEVR